MEWERVYQGCMVILATLGGLGTLLGLLSGEEGRYQSNASENVHQLLRQLHDLRRTELEKEGEDNNDNKLEENDNILDEQVQGGGRPPRAPRPSPR